MTATPRILADCIATRVGEIRTAGGVKPVFVLELYAEPTAQTLVKYFNVESKTPGRFRVKHNSDFAKVYRLTTGENPVKRYSEAKHLLAHFHGCRFFVEYERASTKNGGQYLKVTTIQPETPIITNAWTNTGALKKQRKSQLTKPLELPDEHRIFTGQLPEKHRKNTGQVPDDKTLEAAETLGLEAVFNPIKKLPIQGKTIQHKSSIVDAELFNPEADTYFKTQRDNLVSGLGFEEWEANELAVIATDRQFIKTVFHWADDAEVLYHLERAEPDAIKSVPSEITGAYHWLKEFDF